MNQEDVKALNELKILSIDMISRAGSGSSGLVLSMAPIVYTLFSKHLSIRKEEPNWINRDRLVLSSGNVSSLIYAALHLAGYDIKKEDLMNYRSIGAITPGFPEQSLTPGIDLTTGPYGEGIGCAVGMALARRYYQSLIDIEEDKMNLFDFDVYCLGSDRDFMEGAATEALSFAGAQHLDHLIFLYTLTNITEEGDLNDILEEDIVKKYQALGLYVDYLREGFNIKDIDKAISAAKRSKKPALLIFKTALGKESFSENKSIIYNHPLNVDDVANLRKKWNLFLPPFEVSKDSMIFLQNNMHDRVNKKYQKWQELYKRALNSPNPKIHEILNAIITNQLNLSFDSNHYKINEGYREALNETNLKIMNLISATTNLFLGGSADCSLSSHTYINNSKKHTSKNLLGRNIYFGRREHAMGSILNGMASCGLKVFGNTKLIYADFLKPAMRMTAIQNLPVIYIFTHDTIAVGEEGPTMQPIEQLALLRTIPNLIVYRPADIMEVMGSWESILKRNLPTALVISQQVLPKLPGSNAKLVEKGAYILKSEKNKLDGILISSGSELVYALQLAYDLEKTGLDLRVVSMPSMELFRSEGKAYEEQILPLQAKKIVIEAGSPLLWGQYVKDSEYIIGINDYGFSGHPEEVMKKMGFDYESVKMKVESLLK